MKKLRLSLTVLGVFAVGVFAAGCGSKSSGSGAPAGEAEKIGIPACDTYITKMDGCFGKMDPSMRTAMEGAYKETKSSWKNAAGQGDRARDNLKQACDSALASMPAICK